MVLLYQPKEGSVLMCDFGGSVDPEMVKVRPVIVLARNRSNKKLVTIVPLSTTKPFVMESHHHELSINPLPDNHNTPCWAKCDMVATVSLTRLDRLKVRTGKGREYMVPVVSTKDFDAVKHCVVSALRLENLLIKKQSVEAEQ